ncbi:uncharacterized protein LOC124151702 [Haliotis rufescens]|uniref:uncharacterized protein LOC124151702 n=1 Tax=Haliotis rufescens TaxID=6454 RepID=UPI001EB0A2F4|nr:uncharacterized protein LOC124151702 [Haliotis rufescens]
MTSSQQSWVVHVKDVRPRRRTKVNTPVINTYSAQIHRCAELYTKLITDHPAHSYPLSSFPSSRSRDHYLHYVDLKPSGSRSAPPWCRRFRESPRGDGVSTRGGGVNTREDGVNTRRTSVHTRGEIIHTRGDGVNTRTDMTNARGGSVNTREGVNTRGESVCSKGERVTTGGERGCAPGNRSNVSAGRVSDATGTLNRLTTQSNNCRVGPIWLTEHLRSRECGAPVTVTLPHVQENTRTLPPGVHARVLPRNPSVREKIRGRARLDYEMANIKAEAFCEQQRGKYFRTASANLRNRDVRFQEEELREQMRREQGDGEDDVISIVTSPLDREELYSRIQDWIDDVQGALKHSPSTIK